MTTQVDKFSGYTENPQLSVEQKHVVGMMVNLCFKYLIYFGHLAHSLEYREYCEVCCNTVLISTLYMLDENNMSISGLSIQSATLFNVTNIINNNLATQIRF